MNAVTGAGTTLAHSANPAETIGTQPAERKRPATQWCAGYVWACGDLLDQGQQLSPR
jgi:hypothetical protein